MIYILEIPHQKPPTAWSRDSEAAIVRAIASASVGSDETIYEQSSGHELLDMLGYASTEEIREDNEATTDVADLADLLDEHGLDAVYFKAYPNDAYTTEPVSEFQASLDWNGRDLHVQRVYMSDADARAALDDPSHWDTTHQGPAARCALERILNRA